jgi:D-tyrosyl-tRNA(Tyr) deacylase
MRLLVSSAQDPASGAQREALLRIARWEAAGEFAGRPALRHGDHVLVEIPDVHLYHDHVDREAMTLLGGVPEVVVFLSKHRSGSGTPSLTVHPIGNVGPADFGGRPGTLVPTAPRIMTEVLRGIRREAAGLPYEVTFEATHHGPFLDAPAFFIEAGSTEREWGDRAAAEALMRALLSATSSSSPIAVGVGGGHYVPRLTDVALSRDVAFGHLLAGHALPFLTDAMIDQVVARTPDASLVYFHRKALETRTLRDLQARFEARGLRAVREEDLAPLPPKQSY